MDPALILFAIEAAVRLGRKVYDVLVDETHERALPLPLGDLHGDPTEADARIFFAAVENRHLVAPGGPYHGLSAAQRATAYRNLLALEDRLRTTPGLPDDPVRLVTQLHALEQVAAGTGARHPLQRVIGALLEIGIDYFQANPAALGRDSAERRTLTAFIARLDDVDFAEATPEQVVGQLAAAALRTAAEHPALIDDDQRLQALLGGVTRAVVEDVERAQTQGERIRRQDLAKRVGSSVLRGGMAALTGSLDLCLPRDSTATALVRATTAQVLEGIRDREDLFTNDAIALIVQHALRAAGEHAALVADGTPLGDVVARTLSVLDSSPHVLEPATASAIVAAGLGLAAEHAETLLPAGSGRRERVSGAVAAVASGLSDELAGSAAARRLLSRRHLVALTTMALEAVARNPEHLLDGGDDPRRTALAQIIGSVAAAMGDDPARLVTGEGLLAIVRVALRAGVRNRNGLLDLHTVDPRTNPLCRVLAEVAGGVLSADDPRRLLSRDVVLEVARETLEAAAVHAAALGGHPEPVVRETVASAIALAQTALADRVDGTRLPALIRGLLARVLAGTLDQRDAAAMRLAADDLLRIAS